MLILDTDISISHGSRDKSVNIGNGESPTSSLLFKQHVFSNSSTLIFCISRIFKCKIQSSYEGNGCVGSLQAYMFG